MMSTPLDATGISRAMTILYVADQAAGCAFYENILGRKPILNVPGMTEFELMAGMSLGLMPNDGIARILGNEMAHPSTGTGIPRCELYLLVDNVRDWFENAVTHGARLISPIADRDWGDRVCYFADPDGHVIAFAEPISTSAGD